MAADRAALDQHGYDWHKALSQNSLAWDLIEFDMPMLIILGDDDQIVSIGA